MAFLNIKLDKIDFGEAIKFGTKVASLATGNPLFAAGGNLLTGGGSVTREQEAKFDEALTNAMLDSLTWNSMTKQADEDKRINEEAAEEA